MPITVEVKPDFSAFRAPTAEEVAARIGCDLAVAEALLENYIVLPG